MKPFCRTLLCAVLSLVTCVCAAQAQPAMTELAALQRQVAQTGFAGTVLVLDAASDTWYAADAALAQQRFIPASTFKIFSALVALETGVIAGIDSVMPWDGVVRGRTELNRDLTLLEGFRLSAVPHFQALVREIGAQRMQQHIDAVGYGNRDISGGIDQFWLTGALRISPLEQVQFLQRLYNNELPFSQRSMDAVKTLMLSEDTPALRIRGKTGLAVLEAQENTGWWVGWEETAAGVRFFAALLQAKAPGDTFVPARVALGRAALDEVRYVRDIRPLGQQVCDEQGEAALTLLRELIAIPTFNVEGLPQHENPEFLRFAATLERVSEIFGLQMRNVDNRVYEIALAERVTNGVQGELIGVHAHADVVPVNADEWVLADGTRLDPFTVTQIGDRLYGRGTEDDKNGIVAALFAMRALQNSGLPLRRHLKLLIDTREETGGDAMPWYLERNPTPDYNIALDGSYPVIIAEKGYGTVMARFPARAATGEGAEVLALTGGLATNQIPASSSARLQSERPDALITLLNERGSVFAATHGSDFQIQARREGDAVLLEVLGVSAHSSEPESGINPVSRLLAFMDSLRSENVFKTNHFTDAARYATQNWGLDHYGEQLGIAYSHDFMGPLTTAQTFVATDADGLRTAVNLRLPVGREPAALMQQIEARLEDWKAATGVAVELTLSAGAPMYRNPEGAWVNALLDIAVANLDIPREFGSSAGATSIHDLPNGVQFGLALPTEKYTGHNANEFKRLEQFLLDLQIVTEMFARLGTMHAM
jgi:predicted dipeptidase